MLKGGNDLSSPIWLVRILWSGFFFLSYTVPLNRKHMDALFFVQVIALMIRVSWTLFWFLASFAIDVGVDGSVPFLFPPHGILFSAYSSLFSFMVSKFC